MKTEKFQWLSFIILFSLILSPSASFAGVFDNDEENWRRIFRDIKKINSRLVTLETGKMQALENVQKDLFIQIDEIKNLIPTLQGSVEQSQGDITQQFQSIDAKLADIENQIKLDIIASVNQQLTKIEKQVSLQLNQQKIANEKFQANLATQFDQLKSHMAGDMENFHKVSKEFFKEFDQANKQSLDQVVQRLNEQQQSLDKTQEIFKTDLIPAIVQQNEKNIKDLNTVMSQTRNELLTGMSGASKENKDALTAGLGKIQLENQKLIEIFQKSLKEGETVRANIELLSQGIKVTDDHVVRTHGDIVKLKDVLAQQMDALAGVQYDLVAQTKNGSLQTDRKIEIVNENLRVADEKINKMAESLQGLHSQSQISGGNLASLQQTVAQIQGDNALGKEKLNKLISSSTEIASHSNDIHQSLQSVGQALQGIEGGLANVDLANQKLTKLIDILKSMAVEQGKLTQVISGQGDIKQSQNQILRTQEELNKVQAQIGQDQAAVNKRLAELSRKANVNISRNDAIRKTLANIGKRP